MAELVGGKRKLNCKSIVEKYKILKEVEQGTLCGGVVRKYGIAKQTLSNWIKDKSKILQPFRPMTLLLNARDCVDQACYKWLVYVPGIRIFQFPETLLKRRRFILQNPAKWDILN